MIFAKSVPLSTLFVKESNFKAMKFKTNIHCSNCVRSVSGFLNEAQGVEHWEVDTAHPDKILTVSGSDAETVIAAVEEAGFDIVLLEEVG
ncbi:MAG: cation transporter [Saprospiraceae bacterium]|jgi:copper chaperone|nr:cation transporter [Saprospiraceae bacterium]